MILAGIVFSIPPIAGANDQIWFETESTQFGCMTIGPGRIMGMEVAGGAPGLICERQRPDPLYARMGLEGRPEILSIDDFAGFSGDSMVLPNGASIRWRDMTCSATREELICRADDGRGFALGGTHTITWDAGQTGKTP